MGIALLRTLVVYFFVHLLRYPDRKRAAGFAILLIGLQGSGKNIVCEFFAEHGLDRIAASFNSIMDGKMFLVLDEVLAYD
eukprot:gene337-4278_t